MFYKVKLKPSSVLRSSNQIFITINKKVISIEIRSFVDLTLSVYIECSNKTLMFALNRLHGSYD